MRDSEGDVDLELVDLSPTEQVTRGQELLFLLRGPLSDAPPQPAARHFWDPFSALPPQPAASSTPPPAAVADQNTDFSAPEVKVTVKRTFIELVASPNGLRRVRSESAINGDLDAQEQTYRQVTYHGNIDAGFFDPSQCDDGRWPKDSSDASTDEPFDQIEELPVFENTDAVPVAWSPPSMPFASQCTDSWWIDGGLCGEPARWQHSYPSVVLGVPLTPWPWMCPVEGAAPDCGVNGYA